MRGFFLSAYYSIYGTKADSRLAGVNMVAAEDTPLSRNSFDDEMTIMDYLWNKMGKPLFSLHAGELVLRESPVESMQTRISDTIDIIGNKHLNVSQRHKDRRAAGNCGQEACIPVFFPLRLCEKFFYFR